MTHIPVDRAIAASEPSAGSEPRAWRAQLADATARLADPLADRAQYLLREGTMRVGVYAPRIDDQTPHAQDELYLVISGNARFRRGAESRDVAGGDALFVPAGMDHRFENPSDDFATWVVFWGPTGGEGC